MTRPLAILVVEAVPARVRAALALACAAAASGRVVSVHFDDAAVSGMRHAASPAALSSALELGVRISTCPTGAADAARAPPVGVASGGLIWWLGQVGDAELVAF